MFGLQKYILKLYDIKWIISNDKLKEIEEMLYVKFKKDGKYYLIEQVLYTYIDILLGLEDLDFKFSKDNDNIIIQII